MHGASVTLSAAVAASHGDAGGWAAVLPCDATHRDRSVGGTTGSGGLPMSWGSRPWLSLLEGRAVSDPLLTAMGARQTGVSMTYRSTFAGAATAAALALIAAGCGSSSPSSTVPEAARTADQILADTQAVAQSAASVHVTIAGIPGQFAWAALDMSRGNGSQGTATVGSATVRIVRARSDIYVNGPAAFWQSFSASSGSAQVFANRWIKVPLAGSSSAS